MSGALLVVFGFIAVAVVVAVVALIVFSSKKK
jgi:hypothetical protein